MLTFSFTCWFHSISLQNRTRLLTITKVCSKIIGHPVRALSAFCGQQTIYTAYRILHNPLHILHSVFEWLPSGSRLHCPGCRTQRQRATFVPIIVMLSPSTDSKCNCTQHSGAKVLSILPATVGGKYAISLASCTWFYVVFEVLFVLPCCCSLCLLIVPGGQIKCFELN